MFVYYNIVVALKCINANRYICGIYICLFRLNVAFKHLRSYRDGIAAYSSGTLTNVLSQRNAMLQTQNMTPTSPQYTDTGPTCRCAIHWCGTSHRNTQLPILMSWVRPDREILPQPSTHTSERST